MLWVWRFGISFAYAKRLPILEANIRFQAIKCPPSPECGLGIHHFRYHMTRAAVDAYRIGHSDSGAQVVICHCEHILVGAEDVKCGGSGNTTRLCYMVCINCLFTCEHRYAELRGEIITIISAAWTVSKLFVLNKVPISP